MRRRLSVTIDLNKQKSLKPLKADRLETVDSHLLLAGGAAVLPLTDMCTFSVNVVCYVLLKQMLHENHMLDRKHLISG